MRSLTMTELIPAEIRELRSIKGHTMKIQNTELTQEHIGRSVVYRAPHSKPEQGVITSFNAKYVFVRYGSNTTSQATSPGDLEWLLP